MVQRIMAQCVETDEVLGKNQSVFTIVDQSDTDHTFLPMTVSTDRQAIIQNFPRFHRLFNDTDLELLLDQIQSILHSPVAVKKDYQNVLFVITNVGSGNFTQVKSDFFDQLTGIIKGMPPDSFYPIVRFLWTQADLLREEDNTTLQKIGELSDVGQYFEASAEDYLNDIAIMDTYGMCPPMPAGKLPSFPKPSKKFPLSYILSNEANYVAVKTVHGYSTAEERKEFLQEIEFMKKLEYHPHILSLIGCSSDAKFPLILTEHCELGDLLTLVRKLGAQYANEIKILEFNDLVPIAWQISDALTFLASKHIIHRDVAARNVLLNKHKMAKLSDFGLCRHSEELFYHSRGGKLPIKWMAPESIEFANFSTKSDVWSFGILLYEMYSFGKTPFHSLNQEDVLPHLKSEKRLMIPEDTPEWM
ncbi:unnamed protein product, partial [Mesorhabditis spiculigera]